MNSRRRFISIISGLIILFAASLLSADPLNSLAKKIASGARDLDNSKIAVLPFPFHDGRSSQGPSFISEQLTARLAEQKKLRLAERGQLEGVLRETTLQSSGGVDQDTVRQIGRILGVEGVVTGTLIEIDERHVEVVARLINAETGEVLVNASCETRRNWKEASSSRKMEQASAAPLSVPPVEEQRAASDSEIAASLPPPTPVSSSTPEPVATPLAPPPAATPTPRMRVADPIVLDTRGQGGLLDEDYDLLVSNWPTEVNQGGEDAQLMEGFRLLKLRDSSRAIGVFTLLERRYRKQPILRAVAKLGVSLCLFQQGRKSAAASQAESVAGFSASPAVSAAASFVLGRYAETFGRYKKARNHYLDVLRISPFQNRLVKAASVRLGRIEKNFLRGD